MDPLNVRHLRLDPKRRVAKVRRIKLPNATNAAFKYIKEAVRAYPELYFSRLVILGEGDSEEIVVRHLAESFGLEADARSISIVPLGGRYVNHFWRLLNDLGIPHVTLLDLDRERAGGGWGRVKYACAQLERIGVPREKLYTVKNGNGTKVLTDEEVSEIHNWRLKSPTDVPALDGWVNRLESHNVFFCSPLDLDFSMLSAFPAEYQGTAIRGPHIPKKDAANFTQKYAKKLATALIETLKDRHSGGGTYSDTEKELFIWYAYLFLGQGKPSTHILALNKIAKSELKKNCPSVLKQLIARVKTLLDVAD